MPHVLEIPVTGRSGDPTLATLLERTADIGRDLSWSIVDLEATATAQADLDVLHWSGLPRPLRQVSPCRGRS